MADVDSKYLDQAIEIFQSRSSWRPDRARALHKKAEVLTFLQMDEDAEKCHYEASRLYDEIKPANKGKSRDISDSDWDDLVVFWSI